MVFLAPSNRLAVLCRRHFTTGGFLHLATLLFVNYDGGQCPHILSVVGFVFYPRACESSVHVLFLFTALATLRP